MDKKKGRAFLDIGEGGIKRNFPFPLVKADVLTLSTTGQGIRRFPDHFWSSLFLFSSLHPLLLESTTVTLSGAEMADVLFECPRCDAQHQKPRTLDCLREHIARVHLDNLAVFSCPRCCTTFVNPEMAHHHIRMECQVEGLVQVSPPFLSSNLSLSLFQVKDYTKNILSLDFNYLAELQQVENEALALRLACPPPGLDLDDLYMLSKAYGYKLVKGLSRHLF